MTITILRSAWHRAVFNAPDMSGCSADAAAEKLRAQGFHVLIGDEEDDDPEAVFFVDEAEERIAVDRLLLGVLPR